MKIWFIWDVKRFLLHVPLGMAIYELAREDGYSAMITGFLFGMYELTEDRDIKDKAYPDIQGVIGGILVAHALRKLKGLKRNDVADVADDATGDENAV